MTDQTVYPVAVISGMSAESPAAAEEATRQIEQSFEGKSFVSEVATAAGFAKTLDVLSNAWPVPVYAIVYGEESGTPAGGVTKAIIDLTPEEMADITGIEVHVQRGVYPTS